MSDNKKAPPTAQQIKREMKNWLNSLERGGGKKVNEQNKHQRRRGKI